MSNEYQNEDVQIQQHNKLDSRIPLQENCVDTYDDLSEDKDDIEIEVLLLPKIENGVKRAKHRLHLRFVEVFFF